MTISDKDITSNDDSSSEVANADDTNSDPEEPVKSKIEWKSCGTKGYIALSEIIVSDEFRCRENGEDDDVVESYTEVFKQYIKQGNPDSFFFSHKYIPFKVRCYVFR